jgi:hypothetical protein
MYPLQELEMGYGLSTQSRCERQGEILELLEIITQYNAMDVVYNVQQRNTSTCIANSLSDVSDWR